MNALGRTVLVGAMAIALVGLGLPWGAQHAYAAEAPVLTSVWLETATGSATTAVDEAQTFFVKGSFTDADSAESHFVKIKIGNGFAETTTGLALGARTFAVSKVYPDDAPTATSQDPFTLTVKVQDSAGLLSSIWSSVVTVRNVAPTVTSLVLTPTAILDDQFVQATGTFADPGTKDTFTLSLDWGDGSPAYTQSYLSMDAKTFAAGHQYTTPGTYSVTASVTDDDAGLGVLASTLAVSAPNTAPSGVVLSATGVVEGDEATLNGSFADPDTTDTHNVAVQWGDGSTSDVELAAGVVSFTAKHTYANDGTYLIVATVTDPASASALGSLSYVVFKRNHAPADLALSATGAVVGGPGKVGLKFSDPDPLDWHRVKVRWGDGSEAEHLLDAGVFALEASHVYANAGTYNVTVVVVDTYSASVDGAVSLDVRVPTASELVDELGALVQSWDVDSGLQNSLLTKVRSAQSELGWGRSNLCNSLGALANHVSAQAGKKLATDDVDAFWSLMATMNGSMNCFQLDRAELRAAQSTATSNAAADNHGKSKDKAKK
jgi:hypothetical protein